MDKQLVITSGNEKGKVFPLPVAGLFTIGRSNATDTKLTDLRVSRTHCQIQLAGSEVKVCDSKSATGTFVNDQRIDGERTLQGGDVIRVGDTMLRLDCPDNVAEAATLSGVTVPAEAATLAGTVVTSAAAVPASAPLGELVGTTLGHYTVSAFLAAGKGSAIFKAHDNQEDRVVALKVLKPEAAKNEGEMHSLARRLQAVLPLRHPNLVTLYDLGRDRSYCWFALELVHGETLAQIVARLGLTGMVDWQHALRWGTQLGKGLEQLHQQQIIHGALTPGRAWITSADKTAKLGGLVAARPLEAAREKPAARPDDLLGEVAYRAPEQMRGERYGDARTDVYSLGAVLYTLLTGRPPFVGTTPVETLAKVLQLDAAPASPRDFQFSLPSGLEQIILRMLAKHPDDRYADVRQALADLAQVTKGETVHVRGSRTQVAAAEDTVSITCGACGQKLRPRRKFVGAQVKCPTCRKLLVVPEESGTVQPLELPPAKAPAPPEPIVANDTISLEIWGKRFRVPARLDLSPQMVAAVGAILFLAGLMFFVLASWLTAGQKPAAPRSEAHPRTLSRPAAFEPTARAVRPAAETGD
jgi:pSer/pThr/pTyr-binding forkhead associated (FHA) protein